MMDLGQEIGRSIGFVRYLKHRVFSKPLILTFHHLSTSDLQSHISNSKYFYPYDKFDKLVEEIKQDGRIIVSLTELIKRLKDNPHTLFFEKILSITFDDGYLSILEPLKELLSQYPHPFIIFIPTSLVGNSNRWDVLKGYSSEKILNWAQLKDLKKRGIEIGSHTRTHVNLINRPMISRRNEIVISLEELKANLSNGGNTGTVFSYPYGAYDREIINIVKEAGYIGAVANFQGNIRPRTDPWQIPRFNVFSDIDWNQISHYSRSLWLKDLIKDIRELKIFSFLTYKFLI